MTRPCPLLIVDDDENDLYLMERALRSAGVEHPLLFAHHGEEAVQQLARMVQAAGSSGAPLPRLIILDLKMPLRTGLDVLRWVRAQPLVRTVPVILFSSSAHRHDIERAYLLGANAFVVKPGSTAERTEFARSVKSFWLQFAEPPLVCSEGVAAAQRVHALNEAPGAET